MQREPPLGDGAIRFKFSNTINIVAIASILMFAGSLVWFFATQTSILTQIDNRQRAFETTMTAKTDTLERREESRAEAAEKRDEARRSEAEAAAQRLARIEAQLGFLVAVGARK